MCHTNEKVYKDRRRESSRIQPPILLFQNKIIEMYVARDCVEQGVERGRGQWFIRRTFDRKLGENSTLSVVAKFRQDVNSCRAGYF